MADAPTIPATKNQFWSKFLSLHTLLWVLGAAAGICSRVPRLAPWGELLNELSLLLTGGGTVAAVGFMSPRQRAILELHDPTPVVAAPPPAPKPNDVIGSVIGGPSNPTLTLLLICSVFGSGCTLSQAVANSYRGLTVAENVVGAANKQFPDMDKAHRKDIYTAATSVSDGQAKLTAWDVTANRITKTIQGADETVKLCRDAIAEVRAGTRDKAQLAGWIASGIKLGIDVKDLLAAAGVPLKGL